MADEKPHPNAAYEPITKEFNALANNRSPYTAKPALAILKTTTDYLVAKADPKTGLLKLDDKNSAELIDSGLKTLFAKYLLDCDPKKADELMATQKDKDFIDYCIFKQIFGIDRKSFVNGLKDKKTLSALTVNDTYLSVFNEKMQEHRSEYTAHKLSTKLNTADDMKNFHSYLKKVVEDNKGRLEPALNKLKAEKDIELKAAPSDKDVTLWTLIAGLLPEDYSALPKKAA